MNTPFKTGLTHAQAEALIRSGHSNRSSATKRTPAWMIFATHIFTFFNLIFVVLAVILSLCGSSVKNMTFLIVVVINTALGAIQQLRAKRAVEKLSLVAAQKPAALRDGVWQPIFWEELVLGDLVRFCPGDQLCADGVVRAGALLVNESLVTGEADPISKQPGDKLLSGSFVISGESIVELTAVGDDAFAAKLAKEAKQDPKAGKSEMMASLERIIRFVGIALIPIGIALFCHQYFRLELGLRAGGEATVAALVGMIPEGLYLLTSVALAASSLKLSQDRVLVQDINCLETLARADVLCVDKTGTITQPDMALEQVLPLADAPIGDILRALYGIAPPDNDTARAIRAKYPESAPWRCVKYIPFSSENKWCAGEFEEIGTCFCGAPEMLLGSAYGRLAKQVDDCIRQGFRVLLLARQDGALRDTPRGNELEPLALLCLRNPLRPNAKRIFAYFKEQGVAVKVISGDNPAAVSQVAAQAGIEGADRYIDASRLVTQEDYLQAVKTCSIFGRVTPDQKKKLIQALKSLGHTVAMTGDGVNDVLALRSADCSIAMASGAQAARQISHMVLLDSDFGAMPAILGEGRRVINNIQRSATLFLVKNILSLGLALLTMLTGLAYPFAPFHLTLVSVLTIGVPSFFLAMEPNYQPIRGRFLPSVLRQALPGGLTNIAAVLMALFFMESFRLPIEDTRSVCTAILAMVGLLVLFRVSTPFDLFRKVIWGCMAVGLLGSFLLLPGFFNLHITSAKSFLVLAVMLIGALGVFAAMQGIFRCLDLRRR